MKKLVLSLLATALFVQADAQRYVTEVFPSASVTNNIVYANNIEILTGTPVAKDLMMDIYQPAGLPDPVTQRPVVIVLHTGSFLPPIINGQPTGSRKDSSVVEMCTQFAKRGYVAAAVSYRMGWNPAATGAAGQDIRTGTLLQAVYRSIIDAKAAVRFLRASAGTGNTYGIDSTKFILGGLGTGGYIALAYATLDNPSEIALPKFLANTTNATYGFVAGQPYVNQAVLGDFEGYGGLPQFNNPNNSPGHSSEVQFIFNMGGAMGDTSWIAAGDAPMVCFHPVGDPFAPYEIGPVVVPTTGDFVVEVGGSKTVIEFANGLGNNDCFINAGLTDPYTTAANAVNNGLDGLFPFYMTPAQQSGPWEWFDSTVAVLTAQFLGLPASEGTAAYTNSLLTNPDMSKTKALTYIDTVMNYLNPRVVICLGLTSSIEENPGVSASLNAFPNPARDQFEVRATGIINSLQMFDISGRMVLDLPRLNTERHIVERDNLPAGMYMLKAKINGSESILRIVLR